MGPSSRLLMGDILTKTPEPSKLLRGIVLLCKLSSLWHELWRPMTVACNNYMKGKVRCPSLLTSGSWETGLLWHMERRSMLSTDSSYTLILVLPSPQSVEFKLNVPLEQSWLVVTEMCHTPASPRSHNLTNDSNKNSSIMISERHLGR